jgi:hypothetical protein
VEVHLGLYETPWLAAFAYAVAAKAIGRHGGSEVEIPQAEQPSAEEVREITAKVRRRLGLEVKLEQSEEVEPDPEEIATLFEVSIVGFWRGQAASDAWDEPGAGIDAAAGRLIEAARLLFGHGPKGSPTPLEVLTRLLARRLDAAFRRSDLTREVLDDDGDAPWRVARWLAYPDDPPGGRGRGFREEVRYLYADVLGDVGEGAGWADVLGVAPPFSSERIRAAYRARSRETHPDAGGSHAAFARLQAAYEEAKAYLGL